MTLRAGLASLSATAYLQLGSTHPLACRVLNTTTAVCSSWSNSIDWLALDFRVLGSEGLGFCAFAALSFCGSVASVYCCGLQFLELRVRDVGFARCKSLKRVCKGVGRVCSDVLCERISGLGSCT